MLPRPIFLFLRAAFYRTAALISPHGDYAQRYKDYLRATAETSQALSDEDLTELLQQNDEHGLGIVVFPIIDWDFRIQRPRHIATELARKGNRVFCIDN
jgi:hypothetical protein